jgi:hypothetical protein
LVYAIIFASLAWTTFNGLWAWALAVLLVVEIIITLCDFIQEDNTRKVPASERVMHALMGIVYGALSQKPTSFTQQNYGRISWILTLMSAGVMLTGLRDITAAWTRRTGYFT